MTMSAIDTVLITEPKELSFPLPEGAVEIFDKKSGNKNIKSHKKETIRLRLISRLLSDDSAVRNSIYNCSSLSVN